MYEMLIGQPLNQTANHLISHLVVALVIGWPAFCSESPQGVVLCVT